MWPKPTSACSPLTSLSPTSAGLPLGAPLAPPGHACSCIQLAFVKRVPRARRCPRRWASLLNEEIHTGSARGQVTGAQKGSGGEGGGECEAGSPGDSSQDADVWVHSVMMGRHRTG